MARHKVSGPTEKELAILGILWKKGERTVRQVNEEMNKQQRTGYTTTLKLMQIMMQKGSLQRDESERSHVYRPAVSQQRAIRSPRTAWRRWATLVRETGKHRWALLAKNPDGNLRLYTMKLSQ